MPLTWAAVYLSPNTFIRQQGPVGRAGRARLTEINGPYLSSCADVEHQWSILGERWSTRVASASEAASEAALARSR